MPISRRKSCLECRAAKARCSRDPTCFRCVERGLTCNYGPTLPRSTPYSRPADYTSRIGHMVSENVDQVTGPLADPAPADNERRPPSGSDSIDSYDMDPAPDQERWPRGVWLSDNQFIAGIDSTWSEDLIPVLPTEDTFRRFTAQPVEPMNEGQSDSRFGRFRDGDLFNHQQPGPFARIANTQLAESSFGRNHVFSILGNNCRMVSGTQFDIIAKPKRAITGSSFLTTQVLLSQVREYPGMLLSDRLPPFIYPNCVLNGKRIEACVEDGMHICLSKPLTVCATVVQLSSSRNRQNSSYVTNLILKEQTRLMDAVSPKHHV